MNRSAVCGKALDRRAVVACLLQDRGDLVAISSLGSATYDLASAGDSPRNFYLWGAMGGAAAVGLGLALAQPDVPVMALIGDGEALMGMGTFATIAQQAPANLSIVILDNGLYGETGSQTSHTAAGTNLATVARGGGIPQADTITDMDGVGAVARRITRAGSGPYVAVIRIDGAEKSRILPTRDGVLLKTRVREALGFASM